MKSETKVEPKKTKWSNRINRKDYIIDDFELVKVQSIDNDIEPYGWVIEMKWNTSSRWPNSNWHKHHNNKIYNSHSSALMAMISIKKNFHSAEFRITAIYSMSQNLYRDYKIDKLISEDSLPIVKYEIKAWKMKEDLLLNSKFKLQKDKSIFIQLENGRIIKAATPNDPASDGTSRRLLFEELIPKGLVEEIDLKEEKWLHPHLLKELKNKIKQ